MSYITHTAIIVTYWDDTRTMAALTFAKSLGLETTGLYPMPINHGITFVILPCGSKAGWPDQLKYDGRLDKFKDWLCEQQNQLGYNYQWVEIDYGEHHSGRQRAMITGGSHDQ